MKEKVCMNMWEKKSTGTWIKSIITHIVHYQQKKKSSLQFSKTLDSSSDDKKDEIEYYLRLSPCYEEDTFEILTWWKRNEIDLPKLANLAKFILAIPATSTASERNFSASGITVTQLSSSIDPNTVDSILFLRSNSDLLEDNNILDIVNNFVCDSENYQREYSINDTECTNL